METRFKLGDIVIYRPTGEMGRVESVRNGSDVTDAPDRLTVRVANRRLPSTRAALFERPDKHWLKQMDKELPMIMSALEQAGLWEFRSGSTFYRVPKKKQKKKRTTRSKSDDELFRTLSAWYTRTALARLSSGELYKQWQADAGKIPQTKGPLYGIPAALKRRNSE